jgi:copper(I)-binding protein
MSRKTYDLNRLRKTYPLIRRKPVFADLELSIIETVKLRYFEGEFSKTYNFEKVHAESPICVATPENENLNAYIISVNQSQVTIEISAPAQASPEVFVHLQVISRSSS